MGNWFSPSAAAAVLTREYRIKIVLIGHTETGKSHFLNKVVSDDVGYRETTHPTYGMYADTLRREGVIYDFSELGYVSLPVCPSDYLDTERAQCVMWFIDSHDTIEDIYPMRDKIISMMNGRDVEQPRIPLCVVHNIGRPRCRRRKCVTGANGYEWADNNGNTGERVTWNALSGVIDVPFMKQFFSAVCISELSYSECDTPALLFLWIYNNAPSSAAISVDAGDK